MRRVCAVIVTFNRPELLCRCVKALLAQTYPVHILIYDNHSTVRSDESLKEQGILPKYDAQITYFFAEANTGGAGGFHNGLKMAREKGFDDYLLMDDDGYPINAETVSLLMQARGKIGENAILNSLVVCNPETLQLSFSMNRSFEGRKMQEMAEEGLLKDFISPFNGTLVSAAVVDKIGYPKKEFFVYGDETEYTLRAKRNGITLWSATESLYYHPTYVGQKTKLLGFTFAISDVPMWKVYCTSRNSTYYMKLYFGYGKLLKTILRSYLSVVLCKKRKFQRLKFTTLGIWDGLRGDFSRKLDLTV